MLPTMGEDGAASFIAISLREITQKHPILVMIDHHTRGRTILKTSRWRPPVSRQMHESTPPAHFVPFTDNLNYDLDGHTFDDRLVVILY